MTNIINIKVKPAYIAAQSDPDRDHYVFSYTITIENQGKQPAKLLTRHWVITDADGGVQEVHGEGVIGEQPYLKAGESFQYTSGVVLATPVGSMQGSYQLIDDAGKVFDAEIPVFGLAVPHMLH